MQERDLLFIDQFSIIEKTISEIRRVMNKETHRQNSELLYYQKRFIKKKLANYQITDAINTYIHNFQKADDPNFIATINTIRRVSHEDAKIQVIVRPFEKTLEEHLSKNQIWETEALFIIRQVIECVYWMRECKGARVDNLRPEHLVKVWQNPNYINTNIYEIKKKDKTEDPFSDKFRWKLDSLPESYQCFQKFKQVSRPFDSEFLWSEAHQAPEFYLYTQSQMDDETLNQSVVWSIASIFIDMLGGKHLLKSQAAIDKLDSMNYNIEKFILIETQRNVRLSEEVKKFLMSALYQKHTIRTKFKDLIRNPLFKIEIKEPKKVVPALPRGPRINWSQQHVRSVEDRQFMNMSEFLKEIIGVMHEQKVYCSDEEVRIEQILVGNDIIRPNSKILNETPRLKKKSSSVTDPFLESSSKNSIGKDLSDSDLIKMLTCFLKPYKLEYEKNIFLAIICQKICLFLDETNLQNQSDREYRKFLTKFKFIGMRFIILFTLFQGLELNQNIFKIGVEDNCYEDDPLANEVLNQKWTFFQSSGLYIALRFFIARKISEIEQQFLKLNQNKEFLHRKEVQLMSEYSLKQHSVYSFHQHFKEKQLLLAWAKSIQEGGKDEYSRMLTYLVYAMYCHLTHNSEEDEHQIFRKFTSMKEYQVVNDILITESFDFEAYNNFIFQGPENDVNFHRMKVIKKYYKK